jgi:hypothetical protein
MDPNRRSVHFKRRKCTVDGTATASTSAANAVRAHADPRVQLKT